MPGLAFDIVARLAQFQDSLAKVQRHAERTAKSVEGAFAQTRNIIRVIVGAAAVRGAVRSFEELATAADNIGKRAQAVGLTAEKFQTLQFAFTQSGVEAEQFDKAMSKLAVGIADFERGTGEAAKVLTTLGFNASELRGLKLDEALARIADQFKAITDSGQKGALASKLFGEDVGRKLVPFLNEGAEGIARLQEEAKRLGGIFSDELVVASTQFNDNMEKLGRVVLDVKIRALGPLIKDLAEISGLLTSSATGALSFGEKLKLAFSGEVNLGKIVELRTEIQKIDEQLAAGAPHANVFYRAIGAVPKGSVEGLQQQRKELQAQLDTVEKLFNARTKFQEENKPAKAGGTEPPPSLVDPNALKAAAKALADLEEARAKALVTGEQRLADVRLELLDRFHAKGLISEEDFWARRLEVQRASTDAAIKATEREIALREQAVRKAPRGTAEYFQAVKELEDAQRRRNELEEAFANTSLKSYLDAQDAAEGYREEVERLSAQMLELKGRTADAMEITTRLEQQSLRRRAEARGDTSAIVQLDAIRAARAAQAQFNEERERGANILRDLAIEEERIQNSRRVGAITELESLNRTSLARQQAVSELQSISQALQDTAEKSGLPQLTREAKDFGVQLGTLAASSNLLAEKFDSIGQTALGDLLNDFTEQTKTAKEAFDDFGRSIVRQVNELISQELGQRLFRSVFGEGGGPTSFGSLFAHVFGGGGGGGGAVASAAGGGGGQSVVEAILQGFAGMQTGGSFVVGGSGGPDSQLVGLRLTPGERVDVSTPQQQRGGRSITVINNISVPAGTSGASAGQIALEAGVATSRAISRNG